LTTSPAQTSAGASSFEVIKPAGEPGYGEPLPAQILTSLESRFGMPLGFVRVHTDAQSGAMADRAGARAFTYGDHIFLGSREKPSDLSLMAHEVTHVLQQRGGPVLQMSGGSTTSSALEREADANAARVVGGDATSTTLRVSSAGGRRVQGSLWDKIKSAVSGAVSAVGGAIGAVGSAVGSAFTTAAHFLGGAAQWAWAGLKSLGSATVSWLAKAGHAVWGAIKWFGSKAWEAIEWLGEFLWEKLSLLGTLAWSFISNLPIRLWRIIVHDWEGIKGVVGWLWTGLKGAAGWVWGAVSGVFKWLGSGFAGALGWLGHGLMGAGSWALDFIQHPSLSKLWSGLLGSLSWMKQGIIGFVKWGWHGIVAAALWVWEGMKGLAKWLWDGLLGGLKWLGAMVLYLFEFLGGGERLELVWGLIFRLRRLTSAEVAASLEVHVSGQIPYWQVRVDEDSVLLRIGTTLARWFKSPVSPEAITTMHVLHLPKGYAPSGVVHELTHVAQYEKVGAIYIPQALHAQQTSGYDYGDPTQVRNAGGHFSSLNREQQASICEDYYLVIHGVAPAEHTDPLAVTPTTLQPFIDEMRKGKF